MERQRNLFRLEKRKSNIKSYFNEICFSFQNYTSFILGSEVRHLIEYFMFKGDGLETRRGIEHVV